MPPLLVRGRDADIYDLGAGRVLRRARNGRSLAAEATIMAHAHRNGVPTPAVHDITADGAIVMDRVDGPTLLDVMRRQPWRTAEVARFVVAMHERLHHVGAPADLPDIGLSGNQLLHLDLHPANIILTSDGPVLIDWANARSGPAAADLAMTWVLVATGSDDAAPRWRRVLVEVLRRWFLRTYLAAIDRAEVTRYLPHLGARRLADRNVTPGEVARIHRLLRRVGATDT